MTLLTHVAYMFCRDAESVKWLDVYLWPVHLLWSWHNQLDPVVPMMQGWTGRNQRSLQKLQDLHPVSCRRGWAALATLSYSVDVWSHWSEEVQNHSKSVAPSDPGWSACWRLQFLTVTLRTAQVKEPCLGVAVPALRLAPPVMKPVWFLETVFLQQQQRQQQPIVCQGVLVARDVN